jgi:UDP-N-acetyl-D-glucosamine dehydrogenase
MQLLGERGAAVEYNDPYFPQLHKMRHYDYSSMKSVELTAENISSYDCVVISTDHTTYDYAAIVEYGQLVVDTRYATRLLTQHRNKIVLC